MKLVYAIEKLKKLSGIDDISRYEDDIKKLVDTHNNKILNMHNRMHIIVEQIRLGVPDLYDRNIELLKYRRDSSSLGAFLLRFGVEEGTKRHNEKCKLSSHTLDSYIQKYGEVDGKIIFKEYCKSKSMSLEMCIKRHGDEKGRSIFKEYWNNTGFGTSKRAFQKRHGDEWEKYYIEFCEKQGYNNTLLGKQEKYGDEEGKTKYIDTNKRKSKSQSKGAYIQKLLSVGIGFEDIQLLIKERWDNTSINSFCLRYGDEEGKIKYDEFCRTVKENNPICMEYYEKQNISTDVAFDIISKIQWDRNKNIQRVSKESLKYFDIIRDIINDRGLECKYNKDELGLKLTLEEYSVYKRNKLFFYDFFIPKLNLIIEYHGVRFHDDIDYSSTLLVSQSDILNIEYNKDFYKKWFAEYRGYTVLIIRSWKIKEDLDILFNHLSFSESERCKFL